MSVVNVKEMWSNASGTDAQESSELRRGHSVLLDSSDDDEYTILQHADVPQEGDAFSSELTSFRVAHRTVSWVGPLYAIVISTYRPPTGGGFDNPTGSPEDLPAAYRWSGQKTVEKVENDADGQPLTNTVGQPFQLDDTIADTVFEVTRNYLTINASFIMSYMDTVNSDPFFGADPGQVYMDDVDIPFVDEANFNYWQARFRMIYRKGLPLQPDGSGGPAKAWYRRVANKGTIERVGVLPSGEPLYVRILDDEGRPIQEPVYLSEAGERVYPENGDPIHWLEIKRKVEAPFSGLGIF